MDTPEKDKASISASEFQDSPLFNYMCNLSPIDPIKPRNCPLIFNSLNFSSPPSVFASPNVSSFKESRFLRRHQFGTPLKSELASSGNGNKGEGVSAAKLSDMCPYEKSGCSPGNSTGESAYDPPNEHLEFTAEFLRTLKDNSCSPDDNVNPSNANRTDAIPEKESNLASQIQLGEHDSIEIPHSLQSEVHLHGICKLNHELTESRAGKLFLDDSDLLIFNSPTKGKHSEGKPHKIVDIGTMPFLSSVLQLSEEDPSDFPDGMYESPTVAPSISREQHEGEVLETPPKIIGKLFETDEVGTIISEKSQDRQVASNSTADANDDGKMIHSSCKKHGRRRRCLLFEMTRAVEKKSTCYSDDSSSSSFHYNDRCDPNKKEFVTARNINRCSSLKASGIGLHLNAITNTSIDEKVSGDKTLTYGRHLIRTTCSTSSVTSVTCSQKHLVKSLAKTAMEGDLFNHDNQVMKDASPISKHGIVEELNHSSPKKKRRTSESDSKGMACKQCNCKKSKCLKLYCDCFAAGLYCFDPCSCQDCYNKPLHEQTVRDTRKQIEMRNPLAFTPKVIKTNIVPEFGKESNRTPASARHRRGCNCKKSNCLKKYCECLQGGVGCSIGCKCEGCQNIFNQKNETEETEEMEQDGNSVSILVDAVLQDADVQTGLLDEQSDNHQQASGIFAPHSGLSPQESTTSSEKCDLAKKTSKSGFKQSLTVKEPEILRDDFLLHRRVKSTTPNSKRISPHSAGS